MRDTTTGALIGGQSHTVVLFKQGGKYLVIDPSNADFSRILAGASDDIRLCFSKKCKIYTPGPIAPAAATVDPTGPAIYQFRDCIDIAVKLAFNIQLDSRRGMFTLTLDQEDPATNTGAIKYDSLRESAPIKEITNQLDMYKFAPAFISSIPLRLKQSSDVKTSKKVTVLLKMVYSAFDALSKLFVSTPDPYHLQCQFKIESTELKAKIGAASDIAQLQAEVTGFCSNGMSGIVKDDVSVKTLGLEIAAIDAIC